MSEWPHGQMSLLRAGLWLRDSWRRLCVWLDATAGRTLERGKPHRTIVGIQPNLITMKRVLTLWKDKWMVQTGGRLSLSVSAGVGSDSWEVRAGAPWPLFFCQVCDHHNKASVWAIAYVWSLTTFIGYSCNTYWYHIVMHETNIWVYLWMQHVLV